MSGKTLDLLLKDCTVKVSVLNRASIGTAFFVAPGLLLTCAHVVVKQRQRGDVQVLWAKNNQTYDAYILWISPEPKKVDIALLKLRGRVPNHPCVELDVAVREGEEDLRVNDDLFSFGYMSEYRNGAGVVGTSESLTGDSPPLIKFQGGKIQHGLSGAALLNLKTGKVCGIVKETRSSTFPQGGGAVLISTAYQSIASIVDLYKLQRDFHEKDTRWQESVEATSPRLPPISVHRLKTNKHLIDFIFNYVSTLFFLISTLVLWSVIGIKASTEFPTSYVTDLIKDCMKGPRRFSQSIDRKQERITRLKRSVFDAKENSEEEYERLSRYESEIAVLSKVISTIYSYDGIEDLGEKRTIDEIKKELVRRRRSVWVGLEPLREVYDPLLVKIENFFETIHSSSLAEDQDYTHIREFVDYLAKKYSYKDASEQKVSNLLSEMYFAVERNPYSVRRKRLLHLRDTYSLMYWIASLLDVESDSISTDKLKGCTTDITDRYLAKETRKEREERISWLERVSLHVGKISREIRFVSEADIARFQLGIKKEWIDSIHFYGLESSDVFSDFQEVANVRFSINTGWDKVNKKQMISALRIQELSVSKETSKFNDFVDKMGLKVEWRIHTTAHVDDDPVLTAMVHRELNISSCLPVKGKRVSRGTYSKHDPLIPSFIYELNFDEPGE